MSNNKWDDISQFIYLNKDGVMVYCSQFKSFWQSINNNFDSLLMIVEESISYDASLNKEFIDWRYAICEYNKMYSSSRSSRSRSL